MSLEKRAREAFDEINKPGASSLERKITARNVPSELKDSLTHVWKRERIKENVSSQQIEQELNEYVRSDFSYMRSGMI